MKCVQFKVSLSVGEGTGWFRWMVSSFCRVVIGLIENLNVDKIKMAPFLDKRKIIAIQIMIIRVNDFNRILVLKLNNNS